MQINWMFPDYTGILQVSIVNSFRGYSYPDKIVIGEETILTEQTG